MRFCFKLAVFIIAVFISGLGIAISTSAGSGTSPVSSLPYVLSFIFPLSFGTTTFLLNLIFVISEKLILKKNFKNIQYLQIPVALLFGFVIDFGMYLVYPFKTNVYSNQIIMLLAGTAVLALGISLELLANLIYVPDEGFVWAITAKSPYEFGKNKVIFDISLCIISIFASLIFLNKAVSSNRIQNTCIIYTNNEIFWHFISSLFYIGCIKFVCFKCF